MKPIKLVIIHMHYSSFNKLNKLMMGASLTIVKRVSLLPLPAKFPSLNFTSFAALIAAATLKTHLHQIHARLILLNLLPTTPYLTTKLLIAASDLHLTDYARHLFDQIPHPNVSLFNAIIRSYSKHNAYNDAVAMYSLMKHGDVIPDGFTFPHVLKCLGELSAVGLGECVHGEAVRHGFESDCVVGNSLVAFYAKCGRVEMGMRVFDEMGVKSVVSWTSIVSGYVQNGESWEALRVFGAMRETGVRLDWIVMVSVLKACADLEDLRQGRCVHGCLVKMGMEFEADLVVSLTAMYAKSGQVMVARLFFDEMERPGLMMWNAMISGYAKNGHGEEAVKLFREMVSRGIRVDSITLRSAVAACAQVGSLELAKWMDGYVYNSEYKSHVFVNTSLIDMYAKCGSVDYARMVFDRTPEKDVVLWSAMIVGYGLHGCGREAIDVYRSMQQAGVVPNDVTFLGLLTACNHSGLVDEGWELFHSMKDYGIEPQNHHYSCVVDILGRAGRLEQAYDLIKKMHIEPGTSVWGALLSSCKIYRNVTLGEYAAEKLFALDPYEIGHYVQLSNLYASERLWDRVAQVRVLMREKGLIKGIGHSLIEINGKLQAFRVGDRSHPRSEEIYKELDSLERRLKDAGFVPHTESVLHDLNHEETEETLCNHSERLAIAFGLISTAPGTTLRINKNLRACVNCHAATKLISKLVDREIVVRDAKRFHHFKDGSCSCGDYW